MRTRDEPETKTLADVRVSQSTQGAWHGCKYRFKVVVLQGIRPRFTPAPLRRGTLVHAGFEAALRCQWWCLKDGWWSEHEEERRLRRLINMGEHAIREKQDAWLAKPDIAPHISQELRDAADRLVDESCLIFRRSFEALGLHQGRWETLEDPSGQPLIEYNITVPPESVGVDERFEEVGGTIDWVSRDEDGNVWLWDFKTGVQIQDAEDKYATQLQAGFYIALLWLVLKLELRGSINYQIRAAVPKQPKLNKPRKAGDKAPMSKADCLTTWEVYREALVANDLNPADYQDMRAKLAAKTWQRIDRYYRTKQEVQTVWTNVVETSQMMADTEGQYPRNLNPFTCGFCKMREYCLADLRGHDTKFLRKTSYMVEGEAAFYPEVIIED